MVEYWNVGILGMKPRKIHSLSVFPIIPVFHYSNIPLFGILDKERRRKG